MLAVQEQVVDFFEVSKGAKVVLNLIQSLVNTVDDVEEVLHESFHNKDNRAFFVLNSVHRKRLQNNPITKSDFVNLFNVNKKAALEKLFITKLDKWHVDALRGNPITPVEIYDLHKQDLNENFITLLKDYKYSKGQKY